MARTAWPTVNDVRTRLKSAGITLREPVDTERLNSCLAAVLAEVTRDTRRQFVADAADTTRIYDGTGTAELEVDEMVSLTGAVAIGFGSDPGYTLANAYLVEELERPHTKLNAVRGSVPAFAGSAAAWPYLQIFPAGRQNIQVTGRFGYAAEIPADLWEAVTGECAARLAAEATFDPGYDAEEGRHVGRLVKFSDADVSETYDLTGPGAVTGWSAAYAAALKRYARPAGKRLRKMRPAMI